MQALQSPLPFFTDTDGSPLSNGYLYFGPENGNPETTPQAVYWDAAGTQPVAQPVRTLFGYPSRNGAPALIYFAAPVSITVRNRRGILILPIASTRDITVGFLNPMTSVGDLIRGGTAGAATRVAIGTTGQVLSVVGGVPTWTTPAGSFANPMTAAGDLIKGGALGAAGRLAIGTTGQVLAVAGGSPVWTTLALPTLPTYYSFSARRITSDISTPGTILFQDTAFTGGHNDSVSGTPVYTAGTGEFIAPELRRFHVSTSAVIHNGGGSGTMSLQLVLNGSAVLQRDISLDAGTSGEFSFNLPMALALGDVLKVNCPTLGGGVVVKVGALFSVRAL